MNTRKGNYGCMSVRERIRRLTSSIKQLEGMSGYKRIAHQQKQQLIQLRRLN